MFNNIQVYDNYSLTGYYTIIFCRNIYYMRVVLPFSTVVMECALAPATPLPPVQPPRTRMVSESMATTATLNLGLDNDDTVFHLLVESSNMATLEVGTFCALQPPMITGG